MRLSQGRCRLGVSGFVGSLPHIRLIQCLIYTQLFPRVYDRSAMTQFQLYLEHLFAAIEIPD